QDQHRPSGGLWDGGSELRGLDHVVAALGAREGSTERELLNASIGKNKGVQLSLLGSIQPEYKSGSTDAAAHLGQHLSDVGGVGLEYRAVRTKGGQGDRVRPRGGNLIIVFRQVHDECELARAGDSQVGEGERCRLGRAGLGVTKHAAVEIDTAAFRRRALLLLQG